MFDVKGKTVIVTGGAGLLGTAFSRACADNGANVVVVDIDKGKGEALIEKIIAATKNKNVVFLECDITKTEDVGRMIGSTLKRFKKIDALVNNAYPRNKSFGRRFEDVSYEDFCENTDLNLGGLFLVTKEVSKAMAEQGSGSIINIASIYGFSAPRFEIYDGTDMTTPVEYAAIKGATINLTRYLASYLGRHNIRVNSISPGGVYNNQPKKFVENYSKKVLLGRRMATPEDMVGALLFLISDSSSYVTGQNIAVDGGWSL